MSLIALAVSPWLTVIDPIAVAQLVAILSAASAAQLLLGVRRHRPRLVLAGRPRDVREAMIELQSTDSHEVVSACLPRTSKVPLGELPTYLGFEDSSDVAHRHQADALVVLPGARLTSTEVRRLHWALAGVGAELCLSTGLMDVAPQRTRVVSTAGINVLHVSRPVQDRSTSPRARTCGGWWRFSTWRPATSASWTVPDRPSTTRSRGSTTTPSSMACRARTSRVHRRVGARRGRRHQPRIFIDQAGSPAVVR